MKTTWLRAGLLLLASAPLVVGMWALLVPHSFYDDFPLPGRNWVSTLGPYNEHLVRDVGAEPRSWRAFGVGGDTAGTAPRAGLAPRLAPLRGAALRLPPRYGPRRLPRRQRREHDLSGNRCPSLTHTSPRFARRRADATSQEWL